MLVTLTSGTLPPPKSASIELFRYSPARSSGENWRPGGSAGGRADAMVMSVRCAHTGVSTPMAAGCCGALMIASFESPDSHLAAFLSLSARFSTMVDALARLHRSQLSSRHKVTPNPIKMIGSDHDNPRRRCDATISSPRSTSLGNDTSHAHI